VKRRYVSPFRRLCTWLLEWAERLYLHAHGWDRRGEDSYENYIPPDDYGFRRHRDYSRGHAVNAQKQLRGNENRPS